ncbi:MAG: hypothetical protein HKN37_12420 [Rhodothermales bacterium]|nr:hypothetical protein [Rhodothermales bacterium]
MTPRARIGPIALGCFVLIGCTSRDCLPPPPADGSPPELTLTVLFRELSSGEQDTLVVLPGDPPARVDARNLDGVRVVYLGRDPEGLRRAELGATMLTTVGVGIESERLRVDPLTSSCPVPALAGTWSVPPGDPGRTVSLGLIAESWSGLRSWTETVTIRLR